jgi:hypothetical protein
MGKNDEMLLWASSLKKAGFEIRLWRFQQIQ